MNKISIGEMIAKVLKAPGYTFPIELCGEIEQQEIVKATGTVLEFSREGSPRFMPKDINAQNIIRENWKRVGLDPGRYQAKKQDGNE